MKYNRKFLYINREKLPKKILSSSGFIKGIYLHYAGLIFCHHNFNFSRDFVNAMLVYEISNQTGVKNELSQRIN